MQVSEAARDDRNCGMRAQRKRESEGERRGGKDSEKDRDTKGI